MASTLSPNLHLLARGLYHPLDLWKGISERLQQSRKETYQLATELEGGITKLNEIPTQLQELWIDIRKKLTPVEVHQIRSDFSAAVEKDIEIVRDTLRELAALS